MLAGMFAPRGSDGPPPGAGHRYWRLLITANNGGPFMGVAGLGLRDTLGGATITSSASGIRNVASSASSEINPDNSPTKAFAEDPTNQGWLSADTSTAWLKWDFDVQLSGGPYPDIVQYSINGSWNSPTSSPQDFELQWSDDDAAWTTVSTVTGETGWTGGSDLRVFTV